MADDIAGIVLEIPTGVLDNIKKTDRAIKDLALTSAESAGKVNDHWGVVATHGLQTFMDKLALTQEAMKKLGTINVTLNTQNAVQSSEQLSTATQKTSADVSKAVQDMARSWDSLAKVSLRGFDITEYGNNLTEALARLTQLKQDFKNEPIGSGRNQAMADEIRQLEEAIRLYKQAADEKNRALANIQQKQQNQTDKYYLDEQKRLLDRILQLRKDIANISISVQRGTITGKGDMSTDLAQLEQLRKELRDAGIAYKDLRLLASLRLSDEGKIQAEINSQNAKNAGLRQEIDERNKLNAAITRANELVAQGQQGKTRLGSGEEAAIQRQLNSDYKQMLGIIREKGQIQANAAEQGRRMSQQELDLIAALDARYKIYESDIQRVASAYSRMAESAARSFASDKSEQMARNAILLADAQSKAAEAAQKAAQQQADKDRNQAESDLNRLYTERLRLLKEKEQLENKALVNTAQGLPDLTAKENQLLTEVIAKIQQIERKIGTIGATYVSLATKAKHAYALDELRQATALQNQFNKSIDAVNTSNAKQLASEYKRLTAEAQKLAQSMREYTSAGGDRNSTAYQQLQKQFADMMTQRRIIELENVDEVNKYRQQRQTTAYQADLSAFVQNEARKRAETQKTVDEQIAKARQAGQQYAQSFAGAMAQFNNMMSGNASGKLALNLENVQRVLNDLKTAAGKLNILDPSEQNKAKQLKTAIEELNRVVKQYKQVTETKPQVTIADANQAVAIARQTGTLKDYEAAYKTLLEVMRQTPQGNAWKQMSADAAEMKRHIDNINSKMKEFQKETGSTSALMGQLKGSIAAVFSVSAIKGYINELMRVRAQFELQRVALGAIIQDKDEANKTFQKVQQMALESPFSIMQLERATKQIAAFGFETQKLVPTMKMFADIAAGLGVEIDRLVLVMGHLKARNFLEGCLGLGTPVRMHDGSVKRVEDIMQGERIMGDDDTPRVVKQIIRGNEQMYKVSYADGSFRCNQNHILTLYNTDTEAIEDVYVLEYLKTPDAYKGVRRTNRHFEYFDITVEKDTADSYYGFVIDDNRRFQLGDGVVTHNTMVRQFTNMGFNVLGNLSKYYQELEGRMVSVAEVQDRVKKKMVSFADVEEVLKRVTSAGGMFYDMQKKQSDSLWGQMQRIRDAYDLMLNEIGQSNEGFLKKILTLIRNLINSWRAFAPILTTIGTALGTYTAIAVGMRVIPIIVANTVSGFKMLKNAIMGAKAANDALNVSMAKNPYAAVAAAAVAIGVAIWQAVTATDALTESMARVKAEGISDMNNLIFQYRQLASTAQDTTKTYDERKKALDELHRVYRDILPDEMLEIEHIRQMKDGYEEATEAIKAYSAEKIRANLKHEIDTQFGKEMASAIAVNVDNFVEATYNGFKKLPQFADISRDTMRGAVRNIMTGIADEVKAGNLDMDEAHKEFKKRFSTTFALTDEDYKKVYVPVVGGLDAYFNHAFKARIGQWSDGFNEVFEEMTAKYGEITDLGFVDIFSKQAAPAIKQYEELETAVSDYTNAVQRLYDLHKDGKIANVMSGADGKLTIPKADEMGLSAIESVNTAVENLNGKLKDYGFSYVATATSINNALESNAGLTEYFGQINDSVFSNVLGNYEKWGTELKNNPSFDAFIERMKNKRDELILSKTQRTVIDMERQIVGALGGSLDMFDKIKVGAEDSFDTIRKSVEDNIKAAKELRESYDKIMSTSIYKDPKAVALDVTGLDEQQRKELDVQIKLLEALFGLLGGVEKKSGGKGKDPWQDRVSLIKEMNTEYEKLLKYYNESEAKLRVQKSYAEAVSEAFKGIKLNGKNLGDIKIWEGFDKQGMIDQLRAILDSGLKISKEKRAELQKMLAGFKATIDIEIQEERLEKLKQSFTDIFANYDLTKELGNLGVNVDLTYIVGGKPMTLAQARKELQETYNKALAEGQLGDDAEKAYKDAIKKLDDLEHKAQIERLKNYNKYFVQTVGERARIELEYLKKMDEVRSMYEFTDAQRQDALRQLAEEKNKKLSEQVWKDFKEGSVYQMMFQDLDAMSEKTLVAMRTELERIKASFKGLPPQMLKELNKAIQDIDNQIANRNPFKTIGSSFKDLIKFSTDRMKLEKDYQDAIKRSGELADEIFKKETELSKLREKSTLYKAEQVQSQIDNLNNQIDELEKDGITPEEQAKIDAIKKQIKLLEAKKQKLLEIAAENGSEEQAMYSEIKKLEAEVESLNEELETTKTKGESAAKGLSKGAVKAAAIKQAFNQIKQYAEETVSHLDGIVSGLDRMGLLTEAAKDNWDSFKDGFEAVNDIAEGGINVMTGYLSGNPAQMVNGILQGIKGTVNLIATISEIGDKKKERKIKSLKESVEELDRAYKKLEKSMEKAYTFDDYNASYKRMQKTLEAEKIAYREMIALEQAKKKSDKDKIKEYEDALDELADKEAEIRKERIEAMGSTTDYINEAENFVSAWLDAYKETGDGLDALGEQWDEFIKNLFVKQAAAQIVSAKIKPIIDKINKAIEANKTDFDLSDAIDEARQEWEEAIKDIQPILEKLFGSYGLTKGTGELVLSDLQKGIQNITEPQAAAIESYLNSMRFEMFHHTEQLDRLITAIQTQYGGGDSPILTEVRAIRSILTNIDDRFRSITESVTGRGRVLKVN